MLLSKLENSVTVQEGKIERQFSYFANVCIYFYGHFSWTWVNQHKTVLSEKQSIGKGDLWYNSTVKFILCLSYVINEMNYRNNRPFCLCSAPCSKIYNYTC